MTLIFLEQEHKYYSLELEIPSDWPTDFLNQEAFEKTHGPLNGYNYKEMMSATTFLSQFEDHFDADGILDGWFEKQSDGFNLQGEPIYTGKNTEYQGCTREMIKTMWDTKRDKACDYGTFVHLGAENYALHGDFKAPMRPEFRQVKNYLKDCGYEVDTAEKRIVDEEICIAGTVDLLLSRTDDKKSITYYIADWKTNDGKDLTDQVGSSFTSSMHFPLSHLKDLPYWHYALQFSLYRWMLERQGYEFEGQAAVHLKRAGTVPEVIEMPYLKDEIEALVYLRKRKLNQEVI